MRKDSVDEDITAELTTADLAQGKRPVASASASAVPSAGPSAVPSAVRSEDRGKPFPAEQQGIERAPSEVLATSSDVRDDTRNTDETTSLIPNGELDGFRNRWTEVQTGFVDEPRKAVEQADGLVASAMKRLAEVFAEERSNLEKQWDRGDSVSTEDLRVALQRYRSFFHRLLSI
jgi:hypothetical protein